MNVERELQELRERMSHVEQWKTRREEIEQELAKVWVEGGQGEPLPPPAYAEAELNQIVEGESEQVESEVVAP